MSHCACRQETEAQIYPFLIPTLDGNACSRHRPGFSTPRMESRCPLYRRKGGPRAKLDLCGEDKISCFHPGLSPKPSSLRQIAIQNALFRPTTTTTTYLE